MVGRSGRLDGTLGQRGSNESISEFSRTFPSVVYNTGLDAKLDRLDNASDGWEDSINILSETHRTNTLLHTHSSYLRMIK